MNQPNIRMWAKFDFVPNGGATPKYKLAEAYKWVDELKALVGRDGYISLYLCQKREQQPTDAPSMYLQAKGSYNLTGLKDLFKNGTPSGIAYGYPYRSVTFGNKKPQANPLLRYVDDGFLFLFHYDKECGKPLTPVSFEMLWLDGARQMIAQHCKALEMGGYDEELKKCRSEAIPYNKG